ncbi:MAG: CDP-alcohol phosphatidyltransferase family protein [Christensenellales bacterium]
MRRIPLNVPNILTLFRLALVPVITILIYFDQTRAALFIYIIACATDLLDGYIARRHKLVTQVGMLIDPLADKLMYVFIVISFTVIKVLPWYILAIIFVKELLMVCGGIILYYKNIISPANTFGKIAAFIFNVSVAFTFLHEIVAPYHQYFIYFALALMLASLAQYAYLNGYKKLKASNRDKADIKRQ